MNEFPDFVTFSNGHTALKHVGGGRYHRNAGDWSVTTMWKDGKLVCSGRKGPMAHVFGEELVVCSIEKWKEDNHGYLPEGV